MRCRILITLIFCLFSIPGFSQIDGGNFALGSRVTGNYFQNNQGFGIGAGGQFKLSFSKRVNTEWFLDYITTNVNDFAYRKDYHIGWGVQFAPFGEGFGTNKVTPYLEAGQCFDLTRLGISDNNGTTRKTVGPAFSAAVQLGVGASWFISDKVELCLQSQYMVHIGKDAHFDFANGKSNQPTDVHVEDGTILDGHLLLTTSANFYLIDLWK